MPDSNIILVESPGSWAPDDYIPPDLSKEDKHVILKRLKQTLRELNRSYIQVAEDLFNIKKGSYYLDAGYNSFKDYVEKELDIDIRQAQYYVQTFDFLVYQSSIPKEYLQQIGISKARSLVSVITTENKEFVMSDALTCTVSEFNSRYKPKLFDDIPQIAYEEKKEETVKDKIDKTKKVKSTSDLRDSKPVVFYLNEDQRLVMENALQISSHSSSSPSRSINIGLICSSFLATSIVEGESGASKVPIEVITNMLEVAYGVSIKISKLKI